MPQFDETRCTFKHGRSMLTVTTPPTLTGDNSNDIMCTFEATDSAGHTVKCVARSALAHMAFRETKVGSRVCAEIYLNVTASKTKIGTLLYEFVGYYIFTDIRMN